MKITKWFKSNKGVKRNIMNCSNLQRITGDIIVLWLSRNCHVHVVYIIEQLNMHLQIK